MDPIGVVACRDLIAKPLDLRRIGHVGDMRGDAQALRQPRRFTEPLVSAIAGAERSHIATLQPSATSWRTSSRPIPVPPPVTTAIRPAKSFICSCLLSASSK